MSITLSKDTNGAATLTATVDGIGKENFTYKWKYNDEEISNQITSALSVTNPNEDDDGEYVCIVSNEYGDEAVSNTVKLTMISE